MTLDNFYIYSVTSDHNSVPKTGTKYWDTGNTSPSWVATIGETMNNSFTRLALVTIIALFTSHLPSQIIWPGDVNNNGVVNGSDLIYWGLAYNSQGSPRPNASGNWTAQLMGPYWSKNFLGGTVNYAYADTQGDGIVDDDDAQTLMDNFWGVHGSIDLDVNTLDESGNAPPLIFEAQTTAALPNQTIDFDVSLGTATQPVLRFYGLTFRIRYNSNVTDTDGISFTPHPDSWIDPDGGILKTFVHNDPDQGVVEITLVRTNQENKGSFGSIGTLSFQLNDLAGMDLPTVLTLEVESLALMNVSEQFYMLSTQPEDVTLLEGSGGGNNGGNNSCPPIADPVCGSNGVTYLNSCYAEAAGITDYTPGVCFGPCIDPDDIDPSANCPTVYQPVCGCNGETYANQCEAEAAGVLSWSNGPCSNQNTCYDPQLVVASAGTAVDDDSGVISLTCPSDYDPVCACNGVTYPNACVAEASGVTFYTPGTCGDGCVDADDMDPDAFCTADYDPVCGCNGETYANACQADAAGVQSYSNGPCGGTSAWCNEATPISCGDFLAMESTIGAGNDIQYYPGCNNNSFLGNDRVYVLNKTNVGDLQIGLEILTPDLDLDIFLLDDNCGTVECLGASVTSNNQTNNEGILLEDAPIGTYYIVVDAQYANAKGNYRLEVNCGYLYCGDAVELTCGETYYGNNVDGHDDVSLYGCDGNIFNVENNGPEIVHTFTVTDAGPVSIDLTGLSSNLELFLLRSCDRGDCMDYSQNPGTNDEQINAYLHPGMYYVVVDGYNGSVSDYELTVSCENNCDLTISTVNGIATACGANDGAIVFNTTGGSPSYLVQYYGPVSGSFSTNQGNTTISNLPAGVYTVKKTDSEGCSVASTVTISSGSNLSVELEGNDAVCMDPGSIEVTVYNGQAPYTVYVTGPANGTVTSNSNNFIINDLSPGYYTVYITDANGCSVSQEVGVGHGAGDFYFTATPNPANCGQLGSIDIETFNGMAPYQVLVAGPVYGGTVTNSSSFTITNLPGGTYNIAIEDKNWCSYNLTVVVPTEDLSIDLVALDGICGNGSIKVNVNNGTADYHITWNGPESGSTTTDDPMYVISNLPDGHYQVGVTDANGCTDYESITVYGSSGGNLDVHVTPIDAGCADDGGFYISINNGSAPYEINFDGPVEGQVTLNTNQGQVTGLVAGDYHISVEDYNGCTYTTYITIEGSNDLDITLHASPAVCDEYGHIGVVIQNGTGPYQISWSGPANGSAVSYDPTYTISYLPAGTYWVFVTDANGCTIEKGAEVYQTGSLNLIANATHGVCGDYGAISIYAGGGTPAYHINWSGPVSGSAQSQTGQYTITDLPAGSYHIVVTDVNGCSSSTYVTVNTGGGGVYIETSLIYNDCGQYNTVWIDINGGTEPYVITWTGPINGSTTVYSDGYELMDLPPGEYKIKVTDANGCMDMKWITIEPSNLITAEPSPGDCDGNGGSVTINIFGGDPIYTIYWTGPVNGSVMTGNTEYILQNLPAGTYTISYVSYNGCADEVVVHVTGGSGVEVGVNTGPATCVEGGELRIDIFGGTPPFNIMYTGPENGMATTSEDWINIYDLPPGDYTVKVTDANGCMDTTVGTILEIPSDLEINASLIYSGCGLYNTIWIDIYNGDGPYTVEWYGPESGSTVDSDGALELMDLPPGEYKIKVTDANGCMVMVWITVYSNALLQALPNIGECGSDGSITLTIGGDAVAPYTISYTGPESGTFTTNNTTVVLEDLPAGTYTFTLTDDEGCGDVVTVSLINAPAVEVGVNTGPSMCDDGELRIDIFGGTPPFTVMYTGPVDGMEVTSEDWITIYDLPPGDYTVKVTDANGCMDTAVGTILEIPSDLEINASLIYNDCGQYNTIWIDVFGGMGPYTIEWIGPETGSTVNNDGAFEVMDLPPGHYKIKVTDAKGCMVMVWVTVYESPLFGVIPNAGDCVENGFVTITIGDEAVAPFNITYTGPTSGLITSSDNSLVETNLPPGTYTFTFIDANGCTDVDTVTIVGGGSIEVGVNTGPAVCGQGGELRIDIFGGTPPFTVMYTGPAEGMEVTSEDWINIYDLPPGEYTVKVTDANGCMDSTVATILDTDSDLYFEASLIYNECGQYNTIWIDIYEGEGPYTIMWTGPESGMETDNDGAYEIMDLPPGEYKIKITDAAGCMVMDWITVYESPVNIFELSGQSVDCGSTGTIDVTILAGTADYDISWDGPTSGSDTFSENSYVITGVTSGIYTVTITDANGCTEIETITLDNTGGFYFSYMVNNGSCGEYSSIWIDFYGGSPDYTITWTGPVDGSDVTSEDFYDIVDLPTGQYKVTVVDGNGCVHMQIINVVNIASDLVADIYGINGSCGGPGKIRVNIDGDTGPYTISWDGITGSGSGTMLISTNSFSIPNLPAGTYEVSVEDDTGCSTSEVVTVVSVDNVLSLTLTVTQPGCTNMGAVGIVMGTSDAPYAISWDGPTSGSDSSDVPNYMIAGLGAGTYQITITDANGCTGEAEVVLIGEDGTVEADFLAVATDLTVDFDNNSSPGTYSWDFGDGNSSSLEDPSHTYAMPGSYDVCLTVTASCGTDMLCKEVTVTVPGTMAILDVGEESGNFGDTIMVPVVINNVSSLVSLSGSVSVADTEVGVVVGVSPGIVMPQFNDNNLTFNFFDNSGTGVDINQGDTLFYFDVQLTGEPGDLSAITIEETPLPVEVGGMFNGAPLVMQHTLLPGLISIETINLLAGDVQTYWGEGIEDAEINIIDSDNGSTMVMTNSDGEYSMNSLNMGEMYTIEPSKDDDPDNGLSTYALFIGQRFILGMEPPQITSPYQIIAGDANCNDAFTTLDLFLIQQLIIGAKDAFDNCPSWVFAVDNQQMPDDFNSYNVFPYESSETLMMVQNEEVDFIGVKVGDILGHANPNLWTGGEVDERGFNDMILEYDNLPILEGEEIEIPLKAANFNNMVSYQLELAFAQDKLEYLGWENSDEEALANAVANDQLTEGGRIRFSWFSLDGSGQYATSDDAVFSLRFRAKTDIADWTDLISLATDGMPAEAYDADGNQNDIIVQMSTAVNTDEPFVSGFALHQNMPNPFSQQTSIRFELPTSSTATLVIHDGLGREVFRMEDEFAAGMNLVEIDGRQLPAGVYQYTLQSGSFVASRSMVVTK